MLSKDVVIQDLDQRGWANLISMVDRDTQYRILGEERKQKPPRTRIIIVHQGDRLLKAWHTNKGSITEGFAWNPTMKPEDIAKREGVDRVIMVKHGAIGEIYGKFQAKTRPDDDYVKQLFCIYEAIRTEIGEGLKFSRDVKLPAIGYDTARQLAKMFVPENCTVVLYIFEGSTVWASAIAGIDSDHSADMLTSHDALVADGFGFFDWRRDYKNFLKAIAGRFRRPGIGIFVDVKSAARIMKSKTPMSAIAAAQKANDLILDPLPAKIKGILGAGKLFGK